MAGVRPLDAPPLRVRSTYSDGFGQNLAAAPTGELWVAATSGIAHVRDGDELSFSTSITGYSSGPPSFSDDRRTVMVGGYVIVLATGAATGGWSEPAWLTASIESTAVEPSDFDMPYIALVPGAGLAVVESRYLPPRGTNRPERHYDGPRAQLLLVDLSTHELAAVLLANAEQIGPRAIDVNAMAVAFGAVRQVTTWAAGTGERIGSWKAPAIVDAVALHPSGATLALLDRTGTVTTSDLTGAVTNRWSAHADGGASLAWSPDGAWLATGSREGLVRVWSMTDDGPTLLGEHEGPPIGGFAARADGRTLLVAAATQSGGIALLELPD